MSGTCVETPRLAVTAELVARLVSLGGYIHPLFRPSDDDPAAQDRVPLPGQGVLHLAGGLVEQSGLLDRAVALLEIRKVSFRAMVRAGDTIWVRILPGAYRPSKNGRAVQEFDWQVRSGEDLTVAHASVVMLMEQPVEDSGS